MRSPGTTACATRMWNSPASIGDEVAVAVAAAAAGMQWVAASKKQWFGVHWATMVAKSVPQLVVDTPRKQQRLEAKGGSQLKVVQARYRPVRFLGVR